MIALVIPLRRLPRRFDFFSYTVPSALESQLQPGQLVTIPFQSSSILGIVFRLEPGSSSTENLKELKNIVYDHPLFSPIHLRFFDLIHRWYGTSLSTIASMAAPPLQKRKLANIELTSLPASSSPFSPVPNVEVYTDTREHSRLLQQTISGHTLILVPQIYLINEIWSELSDEQKTQAIIWHSELSVKEQFSRWFAIRNNEKQIVIGTRGAVFLPFPKLDTIIVDYEHDGQHKHFDQVPRYHTKDVASLLAELFGARLSLLSYSPSCESYFHARKKKWLSQFNQEKRPLPTPLFLPSIMNMKDERQGGNFQPLSERIIERMNTQTGDMFLFLNRLGFASAVVCQDCGYRETCRQCQNPLMYHEKSKTLSCHHCQFSRSPSLLCPECQSASITFFGVGTEQVETYIRALIVDRADIECIRIDSEENPQGKKHTLLQEQVANQKRHIIIGTQMAFPYIQWEKTHTIALLDLDRQLGLPEFQATEHVWHKIQEIRFRQTKNSEFFIQTFSPSHVLLRSLTEPDRFYRTELNLRRSLGYPPYQYLVRYFFVHMNQSVAKREVERVHAELAVQLTKEKKTITLHPPLPMHPSYFRSQFWYTIIAKCDPDHWQEDLPWMNQHIPETWKIDPRPISLLSP